MWHALALIEPLRGSGSSRMQIRVCSAQIADLTGKGGFNWEPAIVELPRVSFRLWGGEFGRSGSGAGRARFAVSLETLKERWPEVDQADWSGARVTLYAGKKGEAWPWRELCKGLVRSYSGEKRTLSLDISVDVEPFEDDVLSQTYLGNGAAEGGEDLKDNLKPLIIGHARNVEPLLIDAVDNIYQLSSYGAIEAVDVLLERGSDFGPAEGDYPDFAALLAADLDEGRWATCLAEGLVRLGAPAFGTITANVRGHAVGGTTPRLAGEIIALLGDLTGLDNCFLDQTALDAMDASAPYPRSVVITSQTTMLQLAQDLASGVNHVSAVGLDGRLTVKPIKLSCSPTMTLHAQGKALPQVSSHRENSTSPPYYRIEMTAARNWRVQTLDELAFEFNWRGPYSTETVYRRDDLVTAADSSAWRYINADPSAGQPLPVSPATENSHWRIYQGRGGDGIEINAQGELTGIKTSPTSVANTKVALEGLIGNRPASGDYVGQLYVASDTGEQFRWDGSDWIAAADLTTAAQRVIEPEFPSVEIKRYEAGNVGNRTIGHFAKRGAISITEGIWSLPQVLLGSGAASINASSGLVTLSSIDQSGTYTVRYTHTDGVSTDHRVNVGFMDQEATVRSINASPSIQTWFENVTTSRTSSHTAIEGSTSLSGGDWSLVSTSAGISASIDQNTGVVTISNATASGTYTVRYTHTDSVETDLTVNLIYYTDGDLGAPGDPNYNQP